MDIFLLITMGVIIGIVASLLGLGAGILSLLALAYYIEPMGFDDYNLVRVILANNGLLMGVFFFAMTIRHMLAGRVPLVPVIKITGASLPAALGIAWMISRYDWFTPNLFYIIFCLGLGFSIYTLLTHTESSFLESCQHEGQERNWKFLSIGVISGVFQGFTATESSTIVVPFINRLCNVKIEKAIVAATASIAPTLLAASLVLFTGISESTAVPVLWSIIGPLSAGTIIGFFIPFGTLNKIGLKLASYTFSFFLLIITIRILVLEVFYY